MRKFWTEEEETIIREKYPHVQTAELLSMLPGRTVISICGHANKIGVKKTEAFMKSPASGRISKTNDIGKNTRFEKNVPGWNKGMKQVDYMSAEMIERTKKGRFKKGQDPHNAVPIGHERITVDGYIEVKVRHVKNGDKNKNFELKHRLVWIENFGPIPDGFMVGFKDGDSLNIEPENLELRDMKTNLIQNFQTDRAIVKRFFGAKEPQHIAEIINNHPELIELKRKMLTVNSKINESKRKINGATHG